MPNVKSLLLKVPKLGQKKICEFTVTRPTLILGPDPKGFYCTFKRQLLSPRNALRWGYSNAAVVPSVSPSVVPSVRGPCEHYRDYTVACFFVKLGRHVNHDERMNPIDFGGQRSKVKVTMGIYGNKLVNTIATKPFCISLSNLADMLTMMRGWTLLIFEVGGQRSRSQWTYIEISLWTW